MVQPKNLESRDVDRIIDEVMKQYQYADNVFHAHLTQTKEKLCGTEKQEILDFIGAYFICVSSCSVYKYSFLTIQLFIFMIWQHEQTHFLF